MPVRIGRIAGCSCCYLTQVAMDSNDLKPWQAQFIGKSLGRHLNYFYRLTRRMEKVGFLPCDPHFLSVCQAYDAVHRLFVELHYLSCTGGVGRSPKNEE
jgi:hypothetical protein